MFLRQLDYLKQIQTDNLTQIVESDFTILTDTELAAQAEMESYLAQRYNMLLTFATTYAYDNAVAYKAKNLVEYTEAAYAAGTAYVPGDRVLYLSKIYVNIVGSTGVLPTVTTNWTYVVDDKKLFYVTLPQTEWNIATEYAAGAVVWYNDYVYTALVANVATTPSSNPLYWGTGVPYSVTAGTKPTDVTKWTRGDNRNQQIVLYMIDITLYHLHSRINPRQIPELRGMRYTEARSWLKMVASGSITANLVEILPVQGNSIRWGSETKTTNFY